MTETDDVIATSTDNQSAVLVVGATGKQGGATARALLAAGVPVRALVRDPGSERSTKLAELGATLVAGDLYDPDSLLKACSGVRAVFAAFMPDMLNPEKDSERTHGRNLVEAAHAAGVRHYVQTSVSGADKHRAAPGWDEGVWHRAYSDQAPPISDYWESKADVNDLVREAGFASWTILYPTTFMEMYLRPSVYFEGFTSNQLMAVANPNTIVSLIAVDDIGRAAAAAIAEPERFNEVELLLAGDNLTHPQIAEVLSSAWNEEILPPQLPMSPQEALDRGMVAPIVQATQWVRDVGQPGTPDLLREVGIEPLTFEEWARASVPGP